MKTLTFTIEIQSNKERVWKTLWDNQKYTQWTKPFTEGCYYQTESFAEGSKVKFLSPSGDGMLSKIVALKPQEYIVFKHFSMITNGIETPFKEDGDTHNYIESYQLFENENSVKLKVKVDILESWEESMNSSFPKALQIVKELSEL